MGATQSQTIGFDFETAVREKGHDSFNPYHVIPLQLGAYVIGTGARFSAVFRTDPHLTRKDLDIGEDKCDVMRRFVSFVEAQSGKKILVGYGSEAFDRPLLGRLLEECSLKLPRDVSFADARESFLRTHPGIPPGMKSGKLSDVCEYYHITSEGKPHDAATDAEMAAKLFEGLGV